MAAFLAIFALQLPFPLIVGIAALVGAVGGRIAPRQFLIGGSHGSAMLSYGPALIDDDTPTPEHARFRWSRLMRIGLIGFALWALPMAALTLQFGWQHALTQMGWFFTKAAMLTFGGGYAVLPYVYQAAVDHYHWLQPAQMIDGLALGETTPGPLIMVVAFVGYVGGFAQAPFGPEHLVLAGIAAATLATWFTFLPSFLFILAGGPLVESTHNDLKFTAPLTAVTAAVVGVILNLAVFFAWHVLWPQGFGGHFEWMSVLIALFASHALFSRHRNVIRVILSCALIGLGFKLLMGVLPF